MKPKEFEIDEQRRQILDYDGHSLIEGGPGSGKTTIALLKFKEIVDKSILLKNQKVLFLSFARATISRVEEHASNLVTREDKKFLEVNTYHSFFWQLIQSHGYLLSDFRILNLIPPSNFSARCAGLSELEIEELKHKLLSEEGIVCFDLFPELAVKILSQSEKIRDMISSAYPFIFVDEFQDTNEDEWSVIKLLGKKSTIIALADLEQRIFEFRGASVTRIPEFKQLFDSKNFDLGKENNRSGDTDIAIFGDDILTGSNIGKEYTNVKVINYPYHAESQFYIKTSLAASRKRLKTIPGWSIAVLVKSKQETLNISSYLSKDTSLPKVYHEVLIDPTGPTLAAAIISDLLTPKIDNLENLRSLFMNILNHIKGRKAPISQADNKLALALTKYLEKDKITGKNQVQLVAEIKMILTRRCQLNFEGVPEIDWKAVRDLFKSCTHKVLKNIFEDALYIRILNKGAVLNESLSEDWRLYGGYPNAITLVEAAFAQEHFSMASRSWEGTFVMTLHKSKGKEFDEVIIWEDQYRPISRPDQPTSRLQQDRLLLRVGVTRAKRMVTILTPARNPSCLLY